MSHGRMTPEGKLIINMDDFAYDLEELSGLFNYYGWSSAYILYIMDTLAKKIKGQPAEFAYDIPDPRLTREPACTEDEVN